MSRAGEHDKRHRYGAESPAAEVGERRDPIIDSTAEPDDQSLEDTSSFAEASQPDPHARPHDPAGTRPRVHPDSLGPARRELPMALHRIAHPVTPPTEDADLLPALREQAQAPELARAEPPHAARFQFLIGALGALAVAAVAIGIFLIARPTPGPGPAWSSWHPSSGTVDPAIQIADHVMPEYRLNDGSPLVRVTGGPLSFQGQQLPVAMRVSGSTPSELPGNGVFYQLCGDGPSCSLAGTPSVQRGLLLRREALELALYSLRYIQGVDQVVVTFPPAPPTAAKSGTAAAAQAPPSRALFFQPSGLAPELQRPLNGTLTRSTPTVGTINRSADSNLVNQLTTNALYDFTIIQDQQSNPVLLLAPPGLGG